MAGIFERNFGAQEFPGLAISKYLSSTAFHLHPQALHGLPESPKSLTRPQPSTGMGSYSHAALDTSVFAAKIGTNNAVTVDEINPLQELLIAPIAELDHLQQEIDRVSAELAKLREQHASLSRKVDAHRVLMSAIRRTPEDIIREIFLLCLPTDHNPIMSRYEAPMLLTQICSSWRRIAHSTSPLWNAIHIVIPSEIPQRAPTYWSKPSHPLPPSPTLAASHERANGITQWLRRSGTRTLNIVVYDPDGNGSEDTWHIILDAIIAFSQRWGSLDIRTPSKYLYRISRLDEDDVPVLRSLTIQGPEKPERRYPYTDSDDDDDDDEYRFFRTSNLLMAPQLQQISYSSATEDFFLFPLKWEQLTVISLFGESSHYGSDVPLKKVVQLLRRCPCLIEGTFRVNAFPKPMNSETLQEIRLESLESLSLQIHSADMVTLFQELVAPALRRLELFVSENTISLGPVSYTSQLMSAVDRIPSTLEAFTMNPSYLSQDTLHQCLRHLPGLKSLSLRPSWFPEQVFSTPDSYYARSRNRTFFTVDDTLLTSFVGGIDPLLQNLESFECHVPSALTEEGILSFIHSKRSPATPAPLKQLAVTLWRPQTVPMVKELRQYVKEGLDCQISYQPASTKRPYPTSDGLVDKLKFGEYERPWGLLSFDDDEDGDGSGDN